MMIPSSVLPCLAEGRGCLSRGEPRSQVGGSGDQTDMTASCRGSAETECTYGCVCSSVGVVGGLVTHIIKPLLDINFCEPPFH